MRLGAYPCRIEEPSKLYEAYGSGMTHERHRHRYEFNNDYIEQFRKAGMRPVGINPDTNLVEAVAVEGHPWFLGVQFHPEYKSTVSRPHPLFKAFVHAAINYSSQPSKKS